VSAKQVQVNERLAMFCAERTEYADRPSPDPKAFAKKKKIERNLVTSN
jgi:hypothetical protein